MRTIVPGYFVPLIYFCTNNLLIISCVNNKKFQFLLLLLISKYLIFIQI